MKSKIKDYQNLSCADMQSVDAMLNDIDMQLLEDQRSLVLKKTSLTTKEIQPCLEYLTEVSNEAIELGNKAIQSGKVGCLTVAGGQGTRLGFQGPKGAFPLNSDGLTLFEIFAKKILNSGDNLSWAIMTSPINHNETVSFFEKNHYFGLNKNCVFFFQQKMLPFLDDDGDLILETPSKIALGPAGNGCALMDFFESGVAEKWKALGIEQVMFTQIDNLLAEPFSKELIGFHLLEKAEVASSCVEREDLNEHVGLFAKEGGAVVVKEYTELSESERLNPNFKLVNISVFCFQLQWMQKVYSHRSQLPLHKSFKKTPVMGKEPTKPNAWKFEYFIFDCLPFAQSVVILLFPRNRCFAPLKDQKSLLNIRNLIQFTKN